MNAFAEHSSQIYFPSWVYDQYNVGEGLGDGQCTRGGKGNPEKNGYNGLMVYKNEAK